MMAKQPETANEGIAGKATEGLKRAGEAVKGAAERTATNAAALNAKVIDHAEENVRQAFAALRSAATSKSVQDVVKAQGDYVKQQGARSMAQAKEVGELIAQFGRDAMAAWKPKD